MPLLKLWNTIRGRSNSAAAPETAPAELRDATTVGETPTGGPITVKKNAAKAPVPQPSPSPVLSKPGRLAALNVFGGAQPHAALCKLIKSSTARTVVEINVEDGSRAIAVLQTLAKNLPVAPPAVEGQDVVEDRPTIRYIVIDQFEMAGGATTLKQFHQTLRGAEFRPQVYPEPIDRGLTRVAHTIGAVDLILIAAPVDQWQTPSITGLLGRICRVNTQVFFRDGDAWQAYSPSESKQRRAA